MAEITKETIQYLSELCRIGCTEEEKEILTKDLGAILDYIEQLQELDTENVAPCNQVLKEMKNVARNDEAKGVMAREKFLKNAPEEIGGYVRVPTVQKKG